MAKISLNVGNKIETMDKLQELRTNLYASVFMGDFKTYKSSVKAYSKLAADNFELTKELSEVRAEIPLFSKVGLNMLKIMVLNMFRKKSPEEKLLQTRYMQDKARDLFVKSVK